MDSVDVEHEGWISLIDQAYWNFSDPRVQRIGPGTDSPVGFLADQVQSVGL